METELPPFSIVKDQKKERKEKTVPVLISKNQKIKKDLLVVTSEESFLKPFIVPIYVPVILK